MSEAASEVPLGRWLFQVRGVLPVPLLVGLVALARPGAVGLGLCALGVAAGVALRLWAVAHIGPGSRRRDAAVGDLASTGPYRHVRNPLYLGNLCLYAGLAAASGRLEVVAGVILLVYLWYNTIIAWEETRLRAALGAPWTAWAAGVPRWWPRLRPLGPDAPGRWAAAWRSERSTHLAVLVVLAALGLRVALR